jgi:phosphoserine phosphatase
VIEPIIYSDACRCIAEHRKRGDRILIISASGTHLVGPIAARLGWTSTWPSNWRRSTASSPARPTAC